GRNVALFHAELHLVAPRKRVTIAHRISLAPPLPIAGGPAVNHKPPLATIQFHGQPWLTRLTATNHGHLAVIYQALHREIGLRRLRQAGLNEHRPPARVHDEFALAHAD